MRSALWDRYWGNSGGGKPFGPKGEGRRERVIAPKTYRGFDDTQIPDKQYFEELQRVSKNQIIWGGNYFIEHLTNTPCFLIWDKDNSGNFADCEIAWTSFKTSVRKFKYRWNGMLQENMKEKEIRIHPTHKPIALYSWTYKKYLPQGGKVIDTHLGSGSNRIAADKAGNIDFYGYEIDADYFRDEELRYKNYKAQLVMEF